MDNLSLDTESRELIFIETSGFSMWPFVRRGEKLIIKKASLEDLRVGDIILYRTEDDLVSHRLVKMVKTSKGCLFYSRGDNSCSLPELLIKDRFLGKAIGILKKNGKMISFTGFRQRVFHRFIVIIAPLIVKIIKPCYSKLRNYVKSNIYR